MDNIFVIAGIIAVIFLIIKFIEMRFIEKENKPLKLLIRDALVVYISVIVGYFILEQVKPVIQSAGEGASVTPVFTDNPGF
jgi:TctA family transporter